MKKFLTFLGILGLGTMGYGATKYILDVKKVLDEDPELAAEFKAAGYQGAPAEEVARRVQQMRDIRCAKNLEKVRDHLSKCKKDVEERLNVAKEKNKKEGDDKAVEAEIVVTE